MKQKTNIKEKEKSQSGFSRIRAQITNSRNEKEVSSDAEDLKQVRENYEQPKAYKRENINGHNGTPGR